MQTCQDRLLKVSRESSFGGMRFGSRSDQVGPIQVGSKGLLVTQCNLDFFEREENVHLRPEARSPIFWRSPSSALIHNVSLHWSCIATAPETPRSYRSLLICSLLANSGVLTLFLFVQHGVKFKKLLQDGNMKTIAFAYDPGEWYLSAAQRYESVTDSLHPSDGYWVELVPSKK